MEERQRVSELLRLAQRGQKHAALVESSAGIGRTRFLEELSTMARLAGAAPVLADTNGVSTAYAVANSLALRLLETLPRAAREAAKPYASVLGNLSVELRERLQVERPDVLSDKAARPRLQSALTDWLYALCQQHCVLVLVDDLDRVDEESAAWLAALARDSRPISLLLVASLRLDGAVEPPLAARAFQQVAEPIHLAPLTAAQTEELLRSIFGAVSYLASTSERLHALSQGQPAYCFELVKYLVDSGVARYGDGTWALPSHLNDAQLPRSRNDAHLARLAQLTPGARALCQVLSVQEVAFSRDFCLALSELTTQDTTAALVESCLAGVLLNADDHFRFQHDNLRDALLAELTPVRRARAERRLAECLLKHAGADAIERLRAAIPLFRSGERARAEQLVREAARFLMEGHGSKYGTAAPLLEQALALYREAGLDGYSLVHPLATLGTASYFVDHRFAGRYGDAAVDVLEKLLHFELARRLCPIVGPKLALYSALSAAALDLALHRPRAPKLAETLRMLIGSATALNAVATSSVDTFATARYRRALEPLAVLGDDNIAGFLQRCVVAVGTILVDRPSDAMRSLSERAARLDSPRPIRDLPEQLRIDCLGGCNLSIGVLECWRHSPRALELATRIEQFGPSFAMSADQLRSTYYAGDGDLKRAQFYRERVEAHALSLGASWLVATWGPVQSHIMALWTADAMLAKRAFQDLSRLARELPAFQDEALHARVTYLSLRGRHADVLEHLATDTTPPGRVGWTRLRGLLARAYNGLGQHARARELCLEALAPLTEEDFSFVMMSLHVQIELALADAGLGQIDAASAQLDRLIARHADQGGRLARGALHEARARVALLDVDFAAAR
ncbi:MAG TPA: AAA family ATPase, partial [Polyangiales bacterium]